VWIALINFVTQASANGNTDTIKGNAIHIDSTNEDERMKEDEKRMIFIHTLCLTNSTKAAPGQGLLRLSLLARISSAIAIAIDSCV